MTIVGNFIGGKITHSASNETIPVYDPATGKVVRELTQSTAAEVEKAIEVAHAAFPEWSKTAPLRRARVMFNFKALMEKHREELAALIVSEHGKVWSDALGELTRGIEVIEYACGIPHLIKGENSPSVGTGVDSYSLMQPVGVVAGITPFNFPAMVPLWMFPIALACGNTFILKPPALDPSASVRMAELLKEAGLPDGVFNVVHSSNEDAEQLYKDPRIAAVSFVGSSGVAEHIYKTASAHGKRVQAFGAAKNHAIVMPDADLDATVNAIMGGAFGSAGERCMALPVVVAVGDDTADKLIARLTPLIKALRVGPGIQKGAEENEMGPVVSAAHQKKVLGYIDKGEQEGAKLVVDGRGIQVAGHAEGYYVGGTLFDNVTSDMTIWREEIFGPVLSIMRSSDYDSALQLVNSHEFGNGSAIFTSNGHTAREFVQNVEAGMVGVNVPVPVPMAFHSFGGWKRSVFGALNVHGPDGVRFYTRMKTATVRWPSGQQTVSEFSMPTLG
ncbi:malonate-semialdehyde dehydrogenase (acetylating) / methylmalonate-semialdehyde dehydrogenase [Candidatus Pantoea symbiotica]|jgi:malonate-semialdehyde dehydrogenase (acetylating)/methylmalonate-semialdehyde dehydrogenase|uniref:methylmalonate-semialdehyde dehydrogenase (CoA acylating) n=3 Tax=Pantoea TaxID=53335 RepID=A0AAU7TUH5_9GAMM|nr:MULTISPECIES: CoA-acylating methylmalonate-semialdehyde dehydrogenase [Pantoea]MRS21032.1 CoA-acylating methylmalonate-semialdehyde dehydrogenase [Enterobacteriaceae bacterium RIT692]MRT43564.1 CoA-acylating methylmalonate-semialdehyde dehydrogenase [Enterobacteriaceae bacterium RIT702]KAJ9431469.1 CoA-acylating methylmalonate-semialdehyde dehydrogenase [Pantoea sp. YR343]PLR23563.1 methylmalonate-semialdehyde dehydrogenase (CoA acylating) [Pantoea endophytica]PYG47943.1 malonate-semialdehy